MGRTQVPLSGITTTSTYPDGDSYSLVNLRPKNGALHPVPPRKVIQELSQDYDIVFVHQTSEYKNWIGITHEENSSSIYWDILSNQPKLIQVAADSGERINSIEQIGNTLSLITNSNIYYLLFQDGNYINLGEMPDMPVIGFTTSNFMRSAKMTFDEEYGGGTVKPDNFIDATKGLVNKAMDRLVNGGTDKDGNKIEGYGPHLFDAHFVRYAFRLFDGSLTKHSSPILIMPARPIVGKEEEGNIDSMKSISYDFDKAIREGYVEVHGYRIYLNYDLKELDGEDHAKWKDIIQSVDIFISQPLGVSNIENIRQDLPTTDSPRLLNYNLIKGISQDVRNNIENTSTFYLIKSIELGKKDIGLDKDTQDHIPGKDSIISKMENIIFQEVMPDDPFSNHKIGAEVSYSYNNRLHLANLKTTFFNGFPLYHFQWNDTNEMMVIEGEDGSWQFEYNDIGHYNGYFYQNAPGINYSSLLIEVDISIGSTLQKVYSKLDYAATKPFLSSFFTYPDSRAKRVTIYGIDSSKNWYKLFTSPLKKHNLLNIAYFLNEGLLPIVVAQTKDRVNSQDITNQVTLSENKIKVSELNNPMLFPNANTYQAGNGYVLAMATNAMNVSDRNFGQYPLYIFTTQGIWALNTGEGEVAYSTKSSPAPKEVPNTKIICETPFGVVFTTEQGLKIINGDSVEFLSPQIEQPYAEINLELPESHCKDLVLLNNEQSFNEYLSTVDNILFDLKERELIVSKKDANYAYVLNLNSNTFYQTTEKIDQNVRNIFPELQVIGNNKLKDFSDIESADVHISLVSRPFSLGTTDIKLFDRIILRALLKNIQNLGEKQSVIMLHGSNDTVNFPALRGLTTVPCNRKDYDMGLFAASKLPYFLFIFAGIVDKDSKLYYLDIEARKEYDNTKMR